MSKISDKNLAFPCEQSWEEMTERQEGRFCSRCSKIVYGLRDCSFEEALELKK